MKDGKEVSTDILHVKEDTCPDCGKELDTGYECKGCGKDWLHVIEEDKKRREAPCSSAAFCYTFFNLSERRRDEKDNDIKNRGDINDNNWIVY